MAAAAVVAAGGSGEVRWGTSNKKVVAVAEGEDWEGSRILGLVAAVVEMGAPACAQFHCVSQECCRAHA